MGNNYAFIDSQNLKLSIDDQGWKLDYKKFRTYLSDKYDVTSAFIFIGFILSNQSLYDSLKRYGYELVFKPILYLKDGKVKGNVDAELVLHAMKEYPNYDQAVIVTGDGDFRCLVEHFKEKGKLRKLLIPNRNDYSSLLKEFMSHIAFMSDLEHKLAFK